MVNQFSQSISDLGKEKKQRSLIKNKTMSVLSLLAFFIVALVAGCGGGGGGGGDASGDPTGDSDTDSGDLVSLTIVRPIAPSKAQKYYLSEASASATISAPIGAPQQFIAIATYRDGSSRDVTELATWTSTTTSSASISGSTGLATGVDTGTSVITATYNQSGSNIGSIKNTVFKSGTTTMTVNEATLSSIAVTPLTVSVPSGFNQSFIATGSFSDGTSYDMSKIATWTSSNTAIATIVLPGIATTVSTGTTTITATSGSKSGTATLTSLASTLSSITVTPKTASVPFGFNQQFIATGSFSNGTSLDISNMVVWSSNDTAIATVDQEGLVSCLVSGSATITATIKGKSGSASLSITGAVLSSIFVRPLTASVSSGFSQRFFAVGSFSDGSSFDISDKVTWTSSNTTFATVITPGIAASVKDGTAIITATYKGKSGSGTLIVTASVLSSIAVTPFTATIISGETQAFVAIASYSDGTSQDISNSVIWSSNNTSKVTIISSGIATGIAVGSATISATSGGKSGTATLTVSAATLSSIAVTPLTATVPSGLTQTFIAIGSYSDGTSHEISDSVTWSSSNTTFATVISPGDVTSVSTGVVTITASSGNKSGSATLTVTAATLSSIAVTPLSDSVVSGFTKTFMATGAYSDGTSLDISDTVTWTSSNIALATVVSPGVATGISVGTPTITATLGTKSGTASLTVTAAILSSIAVTPVTASIVSGTTKAFVATGTFSDGTSLNISSSVTWTSGTIGVATVLTSGVATGLTAGTSTITATSGALSSTATLTVLPATTLVSIAVTPATSTTAIGGTQAFVATGTYSDASVVVITSTATWTSSNLAVATVLSTGVANGLAAGVSTITATSGSISGTATITVPAASLVSIAVTPATPTIANGATQAFVATGTYSDSSIAVITNTVTWTSSNVAVATILSTGVATGQSGGVVTITATSSTISGSTTLTVTAALGPAPVPLGTAINFAILTKTGVTNAIAVSLAITGDVGASPITAAALNDIPCANVAGVIYGVDAAYSGGVCYTDSPANKTFVDTAVLDMGTAFTNAAGRTLPNFTNHGAGDISGLILVPGLYKWTTGVLVSNVGVTLNGGPNDVWIFQVGGNLTINNSAIITLTGGALAKNIFWQVDADATLGSAADFKGIILSQGLISLNTTAVVVGRLLAQTQVTLQGNTVTEPPL